MIEKWIKANKTFTISTRLDKARLAKDEVKLIKFSNKVEFESHLGSGFFVEWYDEKESASIPVLSSVPNIEVSFDEIMKQNEEIFKAEPPITEGPETVSVTTTSSGSEIVDEVINLMKKNEERQQEIAQTLDEDDAAKLERLNSQGKPFICQTPDCGRIRNKKNLFCNNCLKDKQNNL